MYICSLYCLVGYVQLIFVFNREQNNLKANFYLKHITGTKKMYLYQTLYSSYEY